MLRLGVRLALAGGRPSLVGIAVTATAVAIGTAVMLFALSFEPALQARYARSAWRQGSGYTLVGDTQPSTPRDLMMIDTEDHVGGRPVTRIDVAALGPEAPLPQGLAAWPRTGEAYVSPALAELLAVTPSNQLGDRFGRVVGTLGEEALRAPNELAAVVGTDPQVLRLRYAPVVTELGSETKLPSLSFVISLVAVIAAVGALAPVIVFMITSTRLTAAGRERRLALLRLLGATPGQMQVLAAGEAAAAMVPGVLGGVLLFFLARPLVASFEVDQLTWFMDAVWPPLLQAAVALAVVPVVGIGAALFALRRVRMSPLGTVRGQRPRAPSRWRLIPLLGASVLFGLSVVLIGDRQGRTQFAVMLIGAAFIGLIVGIVVAGPWLTGLVGRLLGRFVRGPAGLLAARRLTDAPAWAFGAISGVIMAVFVASAFSVILGYMSLYAAQSTGLPLQPNSVSASLWVPVAPAADVAKLLDGIRAIDGVESAAAVRNTYVTNRDDEVFQTAWVADCEDLNRTLNFTNSCDGAQVWIGPHANLEVQGDGWSVAEADNVRDSVPGDLYYPATEPLAPGYRTASYRFEKTDYYGMPDIVVDPSALPDGGRRFPADRFVVATTGSPATLEQIRTLIGTRSPFADVRSIEELTNGSVGVLGELSRVVALGTLATLLMAGCSLAVSVAAGLLDRRRPLGLLRLTGMPLGRLRATILMEAAAPLFVTAAISAVLGVAAGEIVLQTVASVAIPMPDPSLLVLLASGLAAAMLVVAATLPLLGRITATESTRFE
ncbi:MAG: hypothetical protein QOH61_1008 [Chloroflexota bacterium]|nr:hypothetical protein [Chloroflexota bacterium]